MDRPQVPARLNFYSFLITSLLLVNFATCVLIGTQIFKHINSSLNDLTLPFYCTLFITGNFFLIYGIKALISLSQKENNLDSNNSLPKEIQEQVSALKAELVDIVLTRKEFNKIHMVINHCTSEIARLEKELFPTVMQKLNDLNIEANQKTIVVEGQKKTLESQIVTLLATIEGEKKSKEANPEIQFKLTDVINYAEKIITGLKVINPLPKEEFIPENHYANEIPLGVNPLKIESCSSRGYVFGDKVVKKAEVKLENSSN